MSLRVRLIVLMCAVLLVSLALEGAVTYSNARRSVRHEMRAALVVGRQTIESAVARTNHLGDLDRLVASFDGNRHLRVRLYGEAAILAAPKAERSAFGRVPDWFVRLIAAAPQHEQILIKLDAGHHAAIVIETDPYNETLEVWNEFTEGLIAPTIFCALTVLLIYLFIGRMLHPLDRLANALEEVGAGRYRIRLSGRLPPELLRLRDSFNGMAARLEQGDADNRELNQQLLTLQEQERADLARDLHDEVSPILFAISLDAANASRLLDQHHEADARDHVQSIAEAVRYAQQQVRRMLGRLRPIGLPEVGLKDAINNLVSFWRRRRPEIRYELAVDADYDEAPELADTICRVVREALSNAIRHGNPQHVAIVIARRHDPGHDRDEILVEIADDGRGANEPSRVGYGLLGIGERVEAVGGRLTLANRSGAGFVVSAVFPGRSATDRVLARARDALL
jgi:two-component system sensor histidine kinase UhpB